MFFSKKIVSAGLLMTLVFGASGVQATEVDQQYAAKVNPVTGMPHKKPIGDKDTLKEWKEAKKKRDVKSKKEVKSRSEFKKSNKNV